MPESHTTRPAPTGRRPQLTELQRTQVDRARQLATANADAIAAGYDRINQDDQALVYGYAFGVARGTVSGLLEIIAELTGGAR
jgi:hypothetical protein